MNPHRIRDLLKTGRKIEAIKVYRQQTGAGLREAKEAVDAIERELHRLLSSMTPPPSPPLTSPSPESASSTGSNLRAMLSGFAENLSARALAEGQPGIYERDEEIIQVLQALASPLKGRVVLVGPPRAGKTAVALAVAGRMARKECPPELAGREVWRVRPGSLPGLASPGNWQAALDQVLSEWAYHPEIILFFDEIARAARLPGGTDEEGNAPLDVATVLATGLKRSHGLCLAEADDTGWRRFSETYTDYGLLFLPVHVEEHSLATARVVTQHVAEDLSILHGLTVTDEAIEQALDLSQRYALDRAQPGKTIDLLHDALAVAAHESGAPLTAEDVIRRFGEQSGLPRMLLDDDVPFNEPEVLRYFKSRVLAQDQAVDAIVQSLSLLRARVNNPLRPMGVFLFLGPTGVGKTELARALAEYLYGQRDRMVRFNMADYSNPYQETQLFGNPFANGLSLRRGQLTNRLSGKAFAVIVLDEFEKAFPTIYQRFLQLFDEGLLVNGNDETVNLRNSIIILTSNFGSQFIEQGRIGFNVNETLEAREKRVLSETERYFTPEFMNRIDAVCIFHPLTRAVMADIARREIGDLLRRDGLTRRGLEIDIADEVIEQVVALGYSPHYGARYLKRQIEKTITYPLAREINALPAESAGGGIRLYVKHGRIASEYLPSAGGDVPAERLQVPVEPQPNLAEIRDALPILGARVEALEEVHQLAQAIAERNSILTEMADVSFWDNQAAARRKLDAYQRASSTVELLSSLRRALETLAEKCALPHPPPALVMRLYKFLASELPRVEFTSWLSEPHDTCGAYIQIGIKSKLAAARQWVGKLAKMYLGWAKVRGLSASVLGEDQSPEGGNYLVTLVLSGFGVYGLLQGETGVHRLTQLVKVAGRENVQKLSANVVALPELSDDDLPASPNLEVAARDWNRNGLLLPRLTAQATVRYLNHRLALTGNLPSDDLAAEAARILRTRLYLEGEPSDDHPVTPPGSPSGHLVRSYVLNTKDKGVHDHRTGKRSLKIKPVLAGDGLQEFLDEALQQRAHKKH